MEITSGRKSFCCGKDEPFSHFSFLFYLALVSLSLKSSFNLFLNHQNIMTLDIFPRVVFSPIPEIFCMCVNGQRQTGYWAVCDATRWTSSHRLRSQVLFLLYQPPWHFLNLRSGPQCGRPDILWWRPWWHSLLGETQVLVKKLSDSS